MAYRSKSYTYSGGDVIFPIPFDYIKENDIYVFINGNPTTDFIIENHQVKLTVVPSVLPATILIKSQTNITSAVTEWQDTSLLDDLNLTLSNNQLLYSTQELYDAFDVFSTEITQDVTQQITDLENKTNQQISEFKEEVNETIQEVSDAAEKINELETAVEDAKNAAITAESKATDAALQASNATTQAQLAQQAAQEAEAAVNEIESLSIADKDLSNITEAGKEVIRKNSGSGLSMFDLVVKDHILSYVESKGLGLQGTYVYKDAVPGSRYGYPDFYNECVAQKEAGTEETITVGDVSFTATKNSNGHIFYDIADKATVDEIFSQRGEAWFYGVDTENERVFLPRGTRSQYTVNTDETGDYVEAGLPNITGTMTADISEGVATGALKITNTYNGSMWSGSTPVLRMRNWSLDASLSNPVYGKSDTVQPYATKKLLYIVVGNVKVQSAASDVVDVTTTENDTLPLFYNFYAKDEDMADAVSFVKSTGTFFGGNLYPTAYEKLVARVGTGNVKAHTDDYTDYDFVVNQDEMTFRLPLKNGKETMFSTACKGNGITLGLTNGATNYGVGVTTGTTTALDGYTGLYGTNIGATNTGKINTQNLSMGVTLDPTKSGIVPHIEVPEGYGLYYKLLNAVVNQELVDFAHIQTELNTKLSRSNKEEIVSWGMPDYTAQSTFTLPAIGQTFTVPYDCLLSIHLIAHSAGNVQLRLNNASGAIIVEAASATNQVETQTNVYLKKGWKIYTSSLISYNKCLITPLIDAIGAQ